MGHIYFPARAGFCHNFFSSLATLLRLAICDSNLHRSFRNMFFAKGRQKREIEREKERVRERERKRERVREREIERERHTHTHIAAVR